MEISKEQVDELKSCLDDVELHLRDRRLDDAMERILYAKEIVKTWE